MGVGAVLGEDTLLGQAIVVIFHLAVAVCIHRQHRGGANAVAVDALSRLIERGHRVSQHGAVGVGSAALGGSQGAEPARGVIAVGPLHLGVRRGVQANGDALFGNRGPQQHRVGIGVAELEIGLRPGDGGVHSLPVAGDVDAVRLVLGELHPRVEGRGEQGGDELGDAPAHIRAVHPVVDDSGVHEPLLLGALTHVFVDRERLTRIDHRPLDQLGDSMDVGDPVLTRGVVGGEPAGQLRNSPFNQPALVVYLVGFPQLQFHGGQLGLQGLEHLAVCQLITAD